MRNRTSWRRDLEKELAGFPPAMFEVELTLFLMERVAPGCAAAGWTLLGGYPFAASAGPRLDAGQQAALARARVYLGRLRRGHVWRQELDRYQLLPEASRGYDVADPSRPATRRVVTRGHGRWDAYAAALDTPPAFELRPRRLAGAGPHRFLDRRRRWLSANIPVQAVQPPPPGHDLNAPLAGGGQPLTVTMGELLATARWMDHALAAAGSPTRELWEHRLGRVTIRYPGPGQAGAADDALRVDGLLHLAGMVGAGKSTLRDVLAVWAARNGLRCTLVVSDVAEVLRLTVAFRQLGLRAAPVLGASTRERHIERLHRRLAARGSGSLLAHDDPSFDYLSTACMIDGLRGLEAGTPLRFLDAPCTGLFSADDDTDDDDDEGPPRQPQREGCPVWAACPRQHGYREQVGAEIWVATPASLVLSEVPAHQNAERIRYLELACRRSDLVIVDEADRVQTHLDEMFAPAATLIGRSGESLLDNLQRDKIEELAREGRLQLGEQTTEAWVTAMDTVEAAANRLYALLVRHPEVQRWVTADYFSTWTLHQQLLNDWYPPPGKDGDPDPQASRRQEVNDILDAFRDDPLGDGTSGEPGVDALVQLCHQTLSTMRGPQLSQRVQEAMLPLSDLDCDSAKAAEHALRFEFTLLLAALQIRLDLAMALWPAVQAALNLESPASLLSRRPPLDYLPLVPESPMGNVLGFQFVADDRGSGQSRAQGLEGRTGDLRFFRCAGVGRELMLRMHELTAADSRPGPHVILMSGTSWAGTSSRYHVQVPVHAVLLPPAAEAEAIGKSEFREEFLLGPDGKMLRLSGTDSSLRPVVLEQMLTQLAVSAIPGDPSPLAAELEAIEDPLRRRILLLTGSYEEARLAARFLSAIPEWSGRVCRLVPDDADLDHSWELAAAGRGGRTLRRGDIAGFAATGADVLIAPLLAVERGHNILNEEGQAAIGTLYFLARPHHRPDDINLAVQAIDSWAVRTSRDGTFARLIAAHGSLDKAGTAFRQQARRLWRHLLTRRIAWSSLPRDEQEAFTWDQLVVMWQVIGRLVRGGVPARVVFVDAAFAPRRASLSGSDTPSTSLLDSMHDVLRPYFEPDSGVRAADRDIVEMLYRPFYQALDRML